MAKKRQSDEDILKTIMEKGMQSSSVRMRDEPLEKASLGAQIKSAITPSLQSVSKIEKVSEAAAVGPSIAGGKPGVLDNILEYSKVSADNSVELVSLTKSIKGLHEKNMEDNKELFERLLKSNDAIKTSLEENMREAARARGAGGAGGGGAGGFAATQGEDQQGGGGGGIPDWAKTAAGGVAAAAGAKMLGSGAKKVMAGAKGFGKGLLKGGLLGGLGIAGYSMASQDMKDRLAEFGIGETEVAVAGGAAALGYGAYDAYRGVKGAGEPKVEPKVEPKPETKPEPKVEKKEPQPRDEKGRFTKKEPGVDPTKGAAESAKSTIAKEAGETVAEKAGKTVGKDAVKKAITKSAASKAVSTVAKKIPIIGAIAGLGFALGRAMEGDYKGAAAEAVSGVAGATGVGAVPSLAIDAGLMARDVYKELYGKFPEDDEPDLRNARIAEITAEVTEYVKSLVPQNNESKTEELKPLDELSGPMVPPAPEKPTPQKIEPPTMYEGDSSDMSLDFKKYPGSGRPSVSASENDRGSKVDVISQPPAQQSSAPVIIKGGDTVNNITNASGGGSGGAQGTPSRIPNPWDSLVFGNRWQAYP